MVFCVFGYVLSTQKCSILCENMCVYVRAAIPQYLHTQLALGDRHRGGPLSLLLFPSLSLSFYLFLSVLLSAPSSSRPISLSPSTSSPSLYLSFYLPLSPFLSISRSPSSSLSLFLYLPLLLSPSLSLSPSSSISQSLPHSITLSLSLVLALSFVG